MNTITFIWGVIILFSFVSFLIMSVKLLYKGYPELLEMFDKLRKEKEQDEG